jgi:iron complex transport system ATP-binding protein
MRLARDLASHGRAVVVVVHDLSLAGAYADRIALLDDGRLNAVGVPLEVMTADRVGRVYGLDVQIHRLGASDRPIVLPLRD